MKTVKREREKRIFTGIIAHSKQGLAIRFEWNSPSRIQRGVDCNHRDDRVVNGRYVTWNERPLDCVRLRMNSSLAVRWISSGDPTEDRIEREYHPCRSRRVNGDNTAEPMVYHWWMNIVHRRDSTRSARERVDPCDGDPRPCSSLIADDYLITSRSVLDASVPYLIKNELIRWWSVESRKNQHHAEQRIHIVQMNIDISEQERKRTLLTQPTAALNCFSSAEKTHAEVTATAHTGTSSQTERRQMTR